MKKIILFFIFVFFFSFINAFDVKYKDDFVKYWGKSNLQKVDNILTNWNKKVLKQKDPQKIYEKVLERIDKYLNRNISLKSKFLLLYLKSVIIFFEQEYHKSFNQSSNLNTPNLATSGNIINTGDNKENLQKKENLNEIIKKYKLDYSTLKRDEILVPISGTLYGILGFYIKSLYGNSLVHSILLKNEYGSEADYNVKNLYLISFTGLVLSKTKLVSGIAYFNLNNPVEIPRRWHKTFYVFVELNPINSLNQTNHKLKLKFIKSYKTYETKITSKENGNNAFCSVSQFNSYTYIFRKSKPILENKYFYGRLHKGVNKIYSFFVSSTGGEIALRKVILDVKISNRILVDTGSIEVYINNIKKDNIKAYLDKQRGDAKLYIDFNNYDVREKIKIDIYANVLKTRDGGYIYTKLNEVSDNDSTVFGNYTGDYSILYSDKAYRGLLSDNIKDYFTDSHLYFDKIRGRYLKDK